MKVKISFSTFVRNCNGSIHVQIWSRDQCVYQEQNFAPGPGSIDFFIDWPTEITIITSNKNSEDTIIDQDNQVVEDKAIEIIGISINGFAIHLDMIDQLFFCQRSGRMELTNENYWGFNGKIKINFDQSSPMRYLLKLRNQFDLTRLDWGKM